MKARRWRGEPLIALVVILSVWTLVRAFAWERALSDARAGLSIPHRRSQPPSIARGAAFAPMQQRPSAASFASVLAQPPPALVPLAPKVRVSEPHAADDIRSSSDWVSLNSVGVAGPKSSEAEPLGPGDARPAAVAAIPVRALGLRRWSSDAWVFVRRGKEGIAPGPLAGVYGASQAGAVLRYRLGLSDPHRPTAYLRGTGAINGTREQEIAVGLSARPWVKLPVVAVAELRTGRDTVGARLRPSVGFVTELPPQDLPFGLTGEAYVQAGWVGGRGASAYVDGLMRAEHKVTKLGAMPLRAGAGAWGARQRGAARLDIGPVASLGIHLGGSANLRMEADWRFRIGGSAKPDSGPALTLSAGF